MDPFTKPEDRAVWEGLVTARGATAKRLRQARQHAQQLVTVTAARRESASSAAEQEFFDVAGRLAESFLRQVKLQDIDAALWTPPEPGTLLAAEWEALETMALSLQLAQLNMERLYVTLEADLAAALAGEPADPDAAGAHPSAWEALRPELAGRVEWPETLKRFLADYPEFRAGVAEAGEAMALLSASPANADRVKQARTLNLPALRGQQYRLEGLFRRLPDGEAFLKAFKVASFEMPDVPPEPLTGKVKNSLTDRMLGFLNKKK